MSYRKSIPALTLTLTLVLAPPIAAVPAPAAAERDRPAAGSEERTAAPLVGRVLDLWSAVRSWPPQPRSERPVPVGTASASSTGGTQEAQGGWDPNGVNEPLPQQSPEQEEPSSGDDEGDGG